MPTNKTITHYHRHLDSLYRGTAILASECTCSHGEDVVRAYHFVVSAGLKVPGYMTEYCADADNADSHRHNIA